MRVAPTSARYIPLQRNTYYPSTMVGGFLLRPLVERGGYVSSPNAHRDYQEMVKELQPPRPLFRNVVWAFFVGGTICLVGQGIMVFFEHQGMTAKAAASPTAIVLIAMGALVTGLGWYDRLVKRGGMGATLPITGFANAMVAPAMEFKQEGLIMGVGARLFTIAGPVLVYGMATAFVVGVVRYILTGEA